jgi:tripartite-type tricarboxylate transporter receptor subunit TctC
VFAAGGGNDITARLMGQWLTERLGQPFIIENRPGAGTNIAAEVVVNAPPDGYTLFFANVANAVNATLYEKLNFDFIRDITPVAGIMRVPNILAVSPSVQPRPFPNSLLTPRPIPAGSTWRRPGLEPQGIWPVSCSR